MSTLARLIGFKYLKGQRILTLALILILASTLFSLTAFSLLDFYRGFTAYLGEGEDIVTIYDRRSRTPFTGLVPAYLAERISVVNGVLASSPEVIVPCIMNDDPIFIRGVIPDEFSKLNPMTMVYGHMLELSDVNSVIVGKNLAERLNLKPDDKVLALSVMADQYMEFHVKGIYKSHSVMDDEALAPLYAGHWLRGINYGHVTLIRFKIDRSVLSSTRIFEEIAKEALEPSPNEGEGQPEGIVPRVITSFKIEDVGVEEAQRFMKNYMDRYGVTKESLLILSIMVFFLASVSVISASKILISQHKGEIEVLKSVGASNRTIKADLIAKVLPWSLVSSVIGTSIGILILLAIERIGYVQVLSHGITFHFDPLVLALQLIFTSLIVALSILRSFKSQI